MKETERTPGTLFDKLWRTHEVITREDGATLLWVDRHFVHEGSFHAFDQLTALGAGVARPDLTFGIADHYVPTRARSRRHSGRRHPAHGRPGCRRMPRRTGIALFGLDDPRQGIVHVVGPEQGLTLPGLLIVCGDSHTSTHGAFGAYAFGIGASEVAHVLMTQTLWQKKPKRMRIRSMERTGAGNRREGHRAFDHRAHRGRRRAGARGRIRGRGRSRALDGGPADPVQSLDRGGRSVRHGRARREDHRLPARPALRARRRGRSSAPPPTGSPWRATPKPRSTARSRSTAPRSRPW